ncbi:MAG: hypothetical protein ACRCXZ_10425 [Patescibacteria group bacterium]
MLSIIGVFDCFSFCNESTQVEQLLKKYKPDYFLSSESLLSDSNSTISIEKDWLFQQDSRFLELDKQELETNSKKIPDLAYNLLSTFHPQKKTRILLYGRHFTPTVLQTILAKAHKEHLITKHKFIRIINYHNVLNFRCSSYPDREVNDMLHCYFLKESSQVNFEEYNWSFVIA